MVLEFVILAVAAFVAALAVLLLRKTKRIDIAVAELREQVVQIRARYLIELHQQLRELARVEAALDLPEPLPATRGWAASPDFLRVLIEHVRAARPAVVVECGSGTSTIVLARALQLAGRGHVYTLDHDKDFAEQTRENLRRYQLADWATVIDAPLGARPIEGRDWPWYDVTGLPDRPIDLLVIDGPPEGTGAMARFPAGPLLFGRIAKGGAVILDDADRRDERRAVAAWTKQFPAFVVSKRATEKGCAVLTLPA